MANHIPRMRVKINFSQGNGTIESIYISPPQEKFSGGIPNLFSPHNGQNMYVLSKDHSPENRTYTLSERKHWAKRGKFYNGVMFGLRSDSNGNVTGNPIRIQGLNIKSFVIYFDNEANEYATQMIINGVTYTNSDWEFFWDGIATNEINIQITKWNRPNCYPRITSILADLTKEYVDEILEVQRGKQSIANNKNLEWGILGRYGSLRLYDKDLSLQELANVGTIQDGKPIEVFFYLDDKLIQKSYGNSYDYEFGQQELEISLVSQMDKLENLIFYGYSYSENQSINDFYLYFKEFLINNGFSFADDTEIKNYFSNIKQSFFMVNQKNCKQIFDELNNATMTRTYFNDNNEIVTVVYN